MRIACPFGLMRLCGTILPGNCLPVVGSMIGTSIEQAPSDHNNPLVLNKRNCTYQAPNATRPANRTRPARESGVVFGSEIMKKVKSSRAPLSSR